MTIKNTYIFLILILTSIILCLGCISTNNTYQNNIISFEYPDTWNTPEDTNGDGSVLYIFPKTDLGDSKDIKIVLVENKDGIYSNKDLYSYQAFLIQTMSKVYPDDVNDTLIPDPNFKVISNKSVNVNGLTGFNTVFQHSEYGTLGDKPIITEYMILQKGKDYYELRLELSSKALASSSNILENTHNDFQIIANSFKIN